MQNTDTFIVGAKPAVKSAKAVKEERDDKGFLLVEAKEKVLAEDAVPGIKIILRTPIPFMVILKSLEFWDVDLLGTIKAGEAIIKSQVVQDESWKTVEEDGNLMMSLCAMVAGIYLTPETVEKVKKNSPPPSTSQNKK